MKSLELDDTLSPDDAAEHLATLPLLRDLGATFVDRPRSTIEPRSRHASADERARAGLHRAEPGAGTLPGFVLKSTLGEGGMGIVRMAEQSALGRLVAVKTLRDAAEPGEARRSGGDAAMRLLREAWLTGRLEHPNVIPIYDLGTDDAGRPHIVMRKVEGTSWDALLADPSLVKEKHGVVDLLEWHLRVLVQVTLALSRAHQVGIVHRDVKPENVMVGELGEVYLLDWGIAVSLVDDGSGRLPLARDATEPAGTPCYMAPEMLGESPPRIDERTDVYLVGATLFEIVAGKPPHDGRSFVEMMQHIVRSSPEFPDDVPRELEQVCLRAMARKKEDRYTNVADLRNAILDFLTHRGSSALTALAEEKSRELLDSLASPTPPERQLVYNLFGAARFGFLEALRSWPDNTDARDGLHAVSVRMIGYELEAGSAEAAHSILAEMSEPPEELVARVAAAVKAREEEKRRLEKLDRLEEQYDPNVGRRTRLFVAIVFGVIGVVGPLGLAVLHEAEPAVDVLLLRTTGLTVMCAAFVVWARESLRKTHINKAMAYTLLVGYASQVLAVPGAILLGLPLHFHVALVLALWSLLTVMLAVTTEARFVFASLAYLAAFFAAAKFPGLRFFVQAGANLSLLAVVLVAWSTKEDIKRLEDRARARLGRGS